MSLSGKSAPKGDENASIEQLTSQFIEQFNQMKLDRPLIAKLSNTSLKDVDQTEHSFDEDLDEDEYTGFFSDSDSDTDFDDSDHTSATSLDGVDSYGREWLLDRCLTYLNQKQGQDTMDPDELATTLESTLKLDNEDEVQSRLADIIGYDNLDFVTELVQHRDEITRSLNDEPNNKYSKVRLVTSADKQLRKGKQSAISNKPSMSTNEIVRPRLLTKEERQRRLEEALKARKAEPSGPILGSSGEQYRHVYRSHDAGNILSAFGKRYALPMGSSRAVEDLYEEITVPYPKHRPVTFGDKLVQISDLDLLCSETFKGYSTLNRVQSLVFPVAYGTNANMLICAPTGAGKTDVAMLSILHTIAMYCDPSPFQEPDAAEFRVEKSSFKIVYVAPLKALAAEIVEKLGKRLKWLGIVVKELTGDMQLTRSEILQTQIIVTTPEKWDVVTRKSNGDTDLVAKVKLLIIDEVHMLNEPRGAVIESLVARTLRQVESTQSMIRIVGLSATLPNFVDVADFLKVDRNEGLFFFDASFRPVPLEQHFIGVRGKAGSKQSNDNIDKTTYKKVVEMLRQGHQVMVFVHSRKDTMKTVKMLKEMAMSEGDIDLFDARDHPKYRSAEVDIRRSKSKELREIFRDALGIHHAGLLRSDRNLTERLFTDGLIKVLCCTATLAWGVNLPAAAVIIKGTQVYKSQMGGFSDLDITDVIQIFGRAGRPQFEKYGIAFLCTTLDRLDHFMTAVTQQHPIESRFADRLEENLNAEISLGTVTTVDEGVQWLGYTYLYVRMRKNFMAYGISMSEIENDPLLGSRRRQLIEKAARTLHETQMIIFDERTGSLTAKDVGRIASEFYLLPSSVMTFNNLMKPNANEADMLAMLSMSGEFDGMKAREEEMVELGKLREQCAPCEIAATSDSPQGKINVLLQAYISQAHIESFSLISDTAYVAQNSSRVSRALFLIAMNRHWGHLAYVLLSISKAINKRLWPFQHELAQFSDLPKNIIDRLDNAEISVEQLQEMEAGEIGALVHNHGLGKTILRHVMSIPTLFIDYEISPIVRNILRVHLYVTAGFQWNDRVHGNSEIFWIWVEDSEKFEILHSTKFILSRKHMADTHELDFFIPLEDPLPPQILVRAVSDTWTGEGTTTAISFQHLIRPELENIQTPLLDLRPLPITALKDPVIEAVYEQKFNYFNPMQTMIFHCLYHTESNVLLGSPTGSGKTVAAELAMWCAFRNYPKSKVVYIAPMKALVRERVDDWRARLGGFAGKSVVELTGDSAPDAMSIRDADIIVTTPEKYDGITRNWQTRKYVQQVSLIIMDEIHLLAGDRGPILEMIVSRMNYISSMTKRPVRLLGMSTAVANAGDMAGWLGVREGLFNFPPSVRPVPLETHIDGFQDNTGFCPLMKSMNKPAFMAIKSHSPTKPVLIFVASRRQTRLTAGDLINFCAMEENPKRFLHMDEDELGQVLIRIKDDALKLSLQFGIGQHHAGLVDGDRRIVQELFANSKIQILVATSTLAWGVNLPAHLVIIKGTQFFDGKIEAYKDMDLTDILQMMGRAGRPGFDTSGVAIVYTQISKKPFYRRFLYTGFPVESALHKTLDDHLAAEIAGETIKTRQEALDFLMCTYLFRRVHKNPSYYGLEDVSPEGINDYLVDLVDKALQELETSGCVKCYSDGTIAPTQFLKIVSSYYISHKTARNLLTKIRRQMSFEDGLKLVAEASEYDLLPVRHNEDIVNLELSKHLRYSAETMEKVMWDPHVKAFLLMQAHLSRADLPISDYVQDMVSVLDQCVRILQAYIDITAELQYFSTCMVFIEIMQCIKQAIWFDDNPFTALPGLKVAPMDQSMEVANINRLGTMTEEDKKKMASFLGVRERDRHQFLRVLNGIPIMEFIESQKDGVGFTFTMRRKNAPLTPDYKCYCPKFPKPQFEGWFMLVIDKKKDKLITLKRFRPKAGLNWRLPINVSMQIPDEARGQTVQFICISDTYIFDSVVTEEFIQA